MNSSYLLIAAAAAFLSNQTLVPNFRGMGDLAGGPFESRGNAVSADGSVVAGYGINVSGRVQPSIWTSDDGLVGLGYLPGGGLGDHATGVSANGAVLVGSSDTGLGTEAFRWTGQDGMTGLGRLPGMSESRALGISADGSTIVGYSGNQAFRWTTNSGMIPVGDLPGGTNESEAFGTSSDGQYIVGRSSSATGYEAYRME